VERGPSAPSTNASVAAVWGSTRGNDTVLLRGSHFGDAADSNARASLRVVYGAADGVGVVYDATDSCRHGAAGVESDTIVCRTVPGVGSNLQWRVSVGGQWSDWSGPSQVTSYAPPEVLAVDAPLLSTRGGDAVFVNASNIGPGGGFTVAARYGYAETQATQEGWFAVSCVVLIPHTYVRCEAAEGTGVALRWQLGVGGQWGGVTASTGATVTTTYRPPVVTAVFGAAVQSLNTAGGQVVSIQGRDFGPATPTDALRLAGFGARYSDGVLVATSCSVSVPHSVITCVTAPGVGRDHAWQVSVAGVWSNVHLQDFGKGVYGTRYAAPMVSFFEFSTDPGRGVRDFVTQGHERVAVHGRNFGPVMMGASGGITSLSYRNRADGSPVFAVKVSECVMTMPHEVIVCETVRRVGALLFVVICCCCCCCCCCWWWWWWRFMFSCAGPAFVAALHFLCRPALSAVRLSVAVLAHATGTLFQLT
jgi:hypothetical protein